MFGAFRPTASLSGGLLWKIPWRLSPAQKLRHRRRLRRVDNVVTILSTALARRSQQTLSSPLHTTTTSSHPTDPPSELPNPQNTPSSKASPETLSTTVEGQALLSHTAASLPLSQLERRHGKGPKQGDYVPNTNNTKLLSQQAKEEGTIRMLERWKAEMPREEEMLPRDKYTMFDRKAKGYRKGVHKLPKWTRVSQRVNPPGF